MSIQSLPTVNACLNSLSAIFLLLGYYFIRRNNVRAHRISMGAAFLSSIIFLISYLTYHAHIGSKHYLGTGFIRTVYFSILLTHTVLAMAIVPLVLRTLYFALKNDFVRHKKLAQWTWPIWMYVSVTGVVIYWMLYR